MKQETLKAITAAVDGETVLAFNDGLLLGIQALERARVNLAANKTLVQPKTDDELAAWVEQDIKDLRKRLR